MKIVVAQFYTSNVQYGRYAEEINQAYCSKMGYEYYVEKDDKKILKELPDSHPTWYKPKLILDVFEKLNPDWVLFLDIDAIVCDFEKKIEDFIDDSYKIIAANDFAYHSDYNAGVLLVKNDTDTKKFLNEWSKSKSRYTGKDAEALNIGTLGDIHRDLKGVFKTALWHDQTCLTLLSRDDKYRGYFKMIDNSKFNHGEFNDNNFIFHAYTKGHHPYRTLNIAHRILLPKAYKNVETKNIVVYHAYCFGDYLNVVSKQLERLKNSGLYDWCDFIHMTCINTENDFKKIHEIVKNYEKVKLHKFVYNDFEFEGIHAVWSYSQKYNGKIFYFHTKGVSNRYKSATTREFSQRKSDGVDVWKELLELFLIDRYEACVAKLDEVDQVGVTNNGGWWWGNFWWANLDNVRIQSEPIKGGRWAYEAWLNEHRKSSFHEYYHFDWNPYFTTLPVEFYTERIKGKVDILKAEYGELGIQQDEGRPELERKTQDVTDIVRHNFIYNNRKGINLSVDNNTMGGDPLYGVVKNLEINFKIDSKEYFLVTQEGSPLNIKF